MLEDGFSWRPLAVDPTRVVSSGAETGRFHAFRPFPNLRFGREAGPNMDKHHKMHEQKGF